MENRSRWWGPYAFELGQRHAWQLGSLRLRITRHAGEWLLCYHRPAVQPEDEQDWQVLPDDADLGLPLHQARYLFAQTGGSLALMPRLADRSVVVRPMRPIFIPAGQQGSLFVSTPLWVAGYPPQQREALFDLPVIRPNDTWFGADTQRGQIAYATPVFARTELVHLTPRAFRAVTPVHFRNASGIQHQLDRLNLPVPNLPLYYSPSQGRFWTSQIEVIWESTGRGARIRIEQALPLQAGPVEFVHAPRSNDKTLLHVLDGFFD